jgi:hypothetical protein
MARNPTTLALQQATDGLLYPSESDAPFEVFRWPRRRGEVNAANLLRYSKHPVNAPVEEIPVQHFFDELVQELSEQGSVDANRYRHLQATLNEHLEGLRAFRVGDRRVAVYLVGKTRDGAWAGVRTTSVET